MSDIPAAFRRLVSDRAAGHCEYCRLAQTSQEATFHVDHIKPRIAGGPATVDNLALACVSCSLRKAARENAEDPDTGLMAPLFNPRTQNWSDHFAWQGPMVVGLTPTGRATLTALAMNRPLVVAIRKELGDQSS
jgi:5-methylcytosine-specific restriction endonuclease McrA